MAQLYNIAERRTSADIVFDHLYDEIVSLRLRPGTKLSEVDVATQFGISRQPVRDAFSRLGSLGFLKIRPQKATEVQKFSGEAIAAARFLRMAIEVEVIRVAVACWDGSFAAEFERNIEDQVQSVAKVDKDAFLQLDYEFHRILCEAAGTPFAFEALASNKAQVDRLCVLSLTKQDEMTALLNDHKRIYAALCAKDVDDCEAAIRTHLSRLDKTVAAVEQSHAEYFAG